MSIVDISWPEKRAFLKHQGYVVIESVVSESVCQQSIKAICDFMDVDFNDRSSWYKDDTLNATGAVPVHHCPEFWALRQEPGLYQAYKEILQQPNLWVTMDRASFKPPCRYDLAQYGDDSNPMHWDYDFRKLDTAIYQGMVYLTDTQEKQGSFACFPQLYRDIVNGTVEQPELFDQFKVNGLFLKDLMDFTETDLTIVSAPAGSLIIFDSRLPHGNICNHHNEPRFVQYLSMFQAENKSAIPELLYQDRAERIDCYVNSRPPSWLRNWKGQLDPEPFVAEQLTELGRKLVGIDQW